ncbi:MAG: L-threonylcarbamoyladenylate synthase [Patescibacteria group bacterium]
MKIIKSNQKKYLTLAAAVINSGGLVIYPSDTVYILAVDPRNPTAVAKLLSFKNRWPGKAISVAVSDIDMAEKYVKLSSKTRLLYQNLLPGPFTLVSPGRHLVAPGIEAENGTLGIRIPDSPYILDLVKKLSFPITATSANLSGRTPHYSVSSFLNTLSQKKLDLIDLIIDAGTLPKNKPSTVIDVTEPELKILRRGDLIAASSQTFLSTSEKNTGKIAQFLLNKILHTAAPSNIVLALSGDLGCGKTVFARAIGRYLGVKGPITSPTFVIYNQYPVKFPPLNNFLHFDLYRLSSSSEFTEINFLSHFKKLTLSCLEWPENMGKVNLTWLKKHTSYFSINFEYVSENTRRLTFSF